MNGNEVKLRLEHSETVLQMIADPDLNGDTLLFAIAALGVYYERQLADRKAKLKLNATHKRVVEVTGWRGRAYGELWRSVKSDLPRYEGAGLRGPATCAGLMIRREGLCGKTSCYGSANLYDPDTGEYEHIGGCTRHWPEIASRTRNSYRAWQANGKPKPANNRGGALLRYFHEDYVQALYKWVGGERYDANTPPPPPTTPRPTLTVINGGRNF